MPRTVVRGGTAWSARECRPAPLEMGSRSGKPARSRAVLRASVAPGLIADVPLQGLLPMPVFAHARQLYGNEMRALYVSLGSMAELGADLLHV